MANRQLLDSARTIAIVNSRQTVTRAHLNNQVVLQIQGAGTFQSAADQEVKNPGQKNYFDKRIHNLKANSSEAMSRKEIKSLYLEGFKAESAGDLEKADELYNEYLNKIQLSFNVIDQSGRRVFQDGDLVTCMIEEAETKTGHRALTVNNVRYKAPVAVEKVKFSITDLVGEEVPSVEDVNANVPA